MTTEIKIKRTGIEEKALNLLGAGHGPEVVASALGVSTSRISQLLSDEEFSKEVIELKFQNLSKHNQADAEYDEMEAKLRKQFKDAMPLLMRPMEILKAMREINAMNRRGQSAPEQVTHQNQVVNLFMPVKITQKFTTNINNQVIQAGSQELLTVQSHRMKELAAASRKESNDVETPKLIEGSPSTS